MCASGKCVSIDDPKKAPGTASRPKRVNARCRDASKFVIDVTRVGVALSSRRHPRRRRPSTARFLRALSDALLLKREPPNVLRLLIDSSASLARDGVLTGTQVGAARASGPTRAPADRWRRGLIEKASAKRKRSAP